MNSSHAAEGNESGFVRSQNPFARNTEQTKGALRTNQPRAPNVPMAMETSLYLPVKRFLESLGFHVKGEIGGCDLVAIASGSPPIVVVGELKLTFNLDLLLQGIDRADICDEVWLAVSASRRNGRERDARVRKLCRRLGFGLLAVSETGSVEIISSPDAAMPRRNHRRRSRIVEEHKRRHGDPMRGGGSRAPIMTAYRQQALACAAKVGLGLRRPRDLKPSIPEAPKILHRNVYGWFERVDRGVYALTEAGEAALRRWPQAGHPAAIA
jgi:hypothetical protein